MLRPGSLSFTALLGALTAMTAIATDMSLPALPTLTEAFRAPPESVQLTLSLFILGYAGGQLVSGPLSDRFGRRPMLLWGLAIYSVSGFACAFATSIGVLVAARLVQGFGAAVGPILGRAIVRDHYNGVAAAQMLSYVMLVFALAPMVAPVLGGALLEFFGWPSIFLAFGVFGLALMLVTWRGFAESLVAPDRDALRLARLAANAGRFFRNRQCVGYMLINSFIFAGLFAFISGSPFVFIEVYGVAPDHFGFYFALSAVGIMLGALANGRLVRRRRPGQVLRLGLALLAISGGVMLLIALAGRGDPLLFALAMLAYVVAQGLSMPNAIAAAMEPLPDMAGMGASFLGAMQMLGGSVAGYAVNALYDRTPVPMAATIAVMGLGAFLCYRLAVPRTSRADDASF